MRDILVLGLIFLSIPFCLSRPHIGVLVWILVSLMNPHRMAWGIAYRFPVALLVGASTLIGFFFHREKARFPWAFEVVLMLVLFAIYSITTLTAFYPEDARMELERLAKTYVMVFVSLFLFQSQGRLRLLLMTIAVSVAAFGVKGAIFSIRTGGEYIVFGPPTSFIADNNALALAELMVLPLLASLAQVEQNRWIKRGLYLSAGLSVLAVIFSYSRGALVGLTGLGIATILLSRNRVRYALFAALFVLILLPLAPKKWHERMSTIQTYEEDSSALGRINAWRFAYNLATDRPLVGGGFNTFRDALFPRYAPDPYRVADSHSIYFEVLGEHGFVAAGLFLCLLFGSIIGLGALRVQVGGHPDLSWAATYATMLQLSLIAFAIGGAFLGLAYFDLFYYLLAAAVCLKAAVRGELSGAMAEPDPLDARSESAAAVAAP